MVLRHVADPQGSVDVAHAFDLILRAGARASNARKSPATFDEQGGAGRRFPRDGNARPDDPQLVG